MLNPMDNDKNNLSQILRGLGFIGIMPIEGGVQLLWSFDKDPMTWDADENMDWVCDRLLPGLKLVSRVENDKLLGWSYAFRVAQPKNVTTKAVFSMMLVKNQDLQGSWSMDQVMSNDPRVIWAKVDEEMVSMVEAYGE